MAEEGVSAMFQTPEPARAGFSWKAVAVAAGVVLLAVLIILFAGLGRSAPAVSTVPDAYAGHLPMSQISLSEATNGAGGRSTFVDGVVTNTGSDTLRGVTLRVTFAMSDGGPPHVEVLPMSLMRTREPYVDLQPVASAPIAPGQSREFRLIFESLPVNWDVQAPEILVVHTDR